MTFCWIALVLVAGGDEVLDFLTFAKLHAARPSSLMPLVLLLAAGVVPVRVAWWERLRGGAGAVSPA